MSDAPTSQGTHASVVVLFERHTVARFGSNRRKHPLGLTGIMAKSLVIVESPAKARTINRYLGDDYTVKASMGHVRDLAKKELAVDVDDGFRPTYQLIEDKKKVVDDLRKTARHAGAVYIATDPDREGEAIGWHLVELLGQESKVRRVLLEEITASGIRSAFEHSCTLDIDKVNAQQARRILDRLVGYKISPLLWDKVRRGISAGRVQSIALRLVVDREREIEAFKSEEYWSITASLQADQPPPFEAKLHRVGTDAVKIGTEKEADMLLESLDGAEWTVAAVDARERRRRPKPPFTTPQLQQAAYQRLGFSVRKTMTLAQQLYEGIDLGEDGAEGLITYMRTDSTRVSPVAVSEAKQLIEAHHGSKYSLEKPRKFKVSKTAQEGHEAIRPTSPTRLPASLERHLDRDQLRLYELIWQRFLASQMSDAIYDTTSADVAAADKTFRATGSVLKFAGFLAAYGDPEPSREKLADSSDRLLPPLTLGQVLFFQGLVPKQHFTQPPPRFSEASLVRELERNGIGRPSTYADILGKLRNRDYVRFEERKFHPTELGCVVVDQLVENFERIMDVSYTARVEERLDRIEAGKEDWVEALDRFWKRFSVELSQAQESMRNIKREETPTDEICDKCGKAMVIKWGRFGRFVACTGYPECRNTKKLATETGEDGTANAASTEPEPTGADCPQCGSALVRRSGRFGKFVGCGAFPKCRYIKPKTIGIDCPDCEDGDLSEKRTKRGRSFFGCTNYPDCKFATWSRPIPTPCPKCEHAFLELRRAKDKPDRLVCPQDGCAHAVEVKETLVTQ